MIVAAYLVGIVGGFIGSVLFSMLSTPFGGKDKRGRQAIIELGKKIGFDVNIYDTLDPLIWENSHLESRLVRRNEFRDHRLANEETFAKHHNWFKGLSEYFGIAYRNEIVKKEPGVVVLINSKAPAYTIPANTVPKRKRNR